MTHHCDFLVLGSGIAGLSYALKVAPHGSVAIITKKEKAESNTNYAQGGVAAVMSAVDSYDLHIRDTLGAGVGLCHRDAVEVMVKEGPDRLRELMALGAQFTQKEGGLDLAREGGHSVNRIVHAHDLTGREIERALLKGVSESPAIRVFEHHAAIDLITEHHLGSKTPADRRNIHCWGVYALNSRENRVETFLARVVMLCTGGLGHVYQYTTNPSIATGDGLAMAFRAGARIGNMEFIQFHPTTLYNSGNPAFLISEAVRGAGARLRLQSGEEFMSRYDSRGALAPRDVVALAIDTELKKRGEDFVLLDLTHLDPATVRAAFPHIDTTCREKYRIDITREPVPVVPAAHYSCGGVVSDPDGRTSVHGLFASGEVSMTGVHGANRLASNSLLEALVFSHRAALRSIELVRASSATVPAVNAWDESGTRRPDEWVLVSHSRRSIQQLMWDYVGIMRSTVRLERASARMMLLMNEVNDLYRKTRMSEGLIELRNLVQSAILIIRCARMRRESRGLHRMLEYPDRDDAHYLCDTIIDAWR